LRAGTPGEAKIAVVANGKLPVALSSDAIW